MAHQLTEPIRRRHDDLRPGVARLAEAAQEIPALSLAKRREVVAEALRFLREDLRLHSEAEEEWLYPEIALLLRHPGSIAGMTFDHELFRELTAALEAADVDDVAALQGALYGLHALLYAHFRKEEEVYLPFLEYEREPQEVAAIEESMGRHERGEPQPLPRAEIDLAATVFPDGGQPVEKLAFLLRYAVRAPSSHNSQPWRFRLVGDAVELLADRSRALPVVDPDDRELVMSCGAALFSLRAAIRHHGLEYELELLPDDGDPDLLARIRLGPERPPSRAEQRLFWAISSRHTNRGPFTERPVAETLLDELRKGAESEGAQLRVLEQDAERNQLADLVAEGDKRQFADGRFRRELASWIHASRGQTRDGMPAHALEIPGRRTPFAPFIVRTFDVGKGTAAHDREIAEHSPVLAVLGTPDDTPRDWLLAGQALARVLLRAAQDDVSASFLNQPIEVAELRASVSRLAQVGVPQLVLRLGYGPTVQPTLRRRLSDVVVLEE